MPGLPLGASPMGYPSGLTVLRHRLVPWDEERIRRAAAEALDGTCTDGAVRRLRELTGGVPRVVVDLLAVLGNSGRRSPVRLPRWRRPVCRRGSRSWC